MRAICVDLNRNQFVTVAWATSKKIITALNSTNGPFGIRDEYGLRPNG